jgi:hypothetical protein
LLWCVVGATCAYYKDDKQTTCVVAAVKSHVRDNAAQLAGSDATSEISADYFQCRHQYRPYTSLPVSQA